MTTPEKYIVWYCPVHGEQWPAVLYGPWKDLASSMDCGDQPHFVRFEMSELAEAQKLLPRPIVFEHAECERHKHGEPHCAINSDINMFGAPIGSEHGVCKVCFEHAPEFFSLLSKPIIFERN